MNAAMNPYKVVRGLGVAKNEFVRFLVVGVLNTGVGFGVFVLLTLGLGVNPAISNAAGYAVGLTIAYPLYRNLVFAVKTHSSSNVLSFILCFAISFLLNQAVLNSLIYAGVPGYISQIFAMATYTLVFFLLNKYVVFI
jgi:putative flippase GtrA